MANAKEIKERMASIEETRKITNAMYLISSSKMKQAKKKLADTEPFFYAMQAEIARILRHVPDMHSQFFDGRESIPAEERKIGYIVVTADKGLAGAYNHNVIKRTEEILRERPNYSYLEKPEDSTLPRGKELRWILSSVTPFRIRHYTDRESFLRRW